MGLVGGVGRRRDSKRGSAGNELTVATDGDGSSSLISTTSFLDKFLGFHEKDVGGIAVSKHSSHLRLLVASFSLCISETELLSLGSLLLWEGCAGGLVKITGID